MSLEQLIGRCLTIGVPGTKCTPEIVRHFQELNAGGLILYRINFESPAQLKKMISDLESALGRRLLVMADHEGGRVIMFRDGITVFPDNLAFGTAGKVENARRQGKIEAAELRRLGIDVNLGPVLDVLTDSYSPNIGIRSYSKDWKAVAEMGAARIRAMQSGGVSACAKHFPGKGHAPVDAHLGLPTIRSTWKEMEAVHLRPFLKALEIGIDMVMSSHPYYPNLDPDPKNIATFSRSIIYDTLRTKLKYDGIICSDDLEMGAIKAICPIGEAGVRAMGAGHDILLVCHDLEAQKEVYRSLLWAYRTRQLPVRELEASVARIDALQAKRKKRFEGGRPHAEPQGAKLAEAVANASVTLMKGRIPKLKGRKVAAVFPQFSSLSQKIMIEKATCREQAFVASEFRKHGVSVKPLIVPIEPGETDLRKAEVLARQSDVTVLFCFDAHLYPSNKQLLDRLQSSGKELAVVLLRDFYDAEFVRGDTACVTDFGWRACQIRACIRKICRP
jgi:beta-N-acetylhexosaminidase